MDASRIDSEDAALAKRIAAGDREALAALYERHAPVLMQIALAIVHAQQEAEDLLHDVFLEAWRTADAYDPRRGKVRTWLAIRMRSRAIDRALSARVRRDAGPAALDTARAVSREPTVDAPRVRAILANLPDSPRVALELAYFEGLSCRDIARRLAIPLGTVKSRLSSGLRSMRQALAMA